MAPFLSAFNPNCMSAENPRQYRVTPHGVIEEPSSMEVPSDFIIKGMLCDLVGEEIVVTRERIEECRHAIRNPNTIIGKRAVDLHQLLGDLLNR